MGEHLIFLIGGIWLAVMVTIKMVVGNRDIQDNMFFLSILIGVPLLLLVGDLFLDRGSVGNALDLTVVIIMMFVIPAFFLTGLWVLLKHVERKYKEDLEEAKERRRYELKHFQSEKAWLRRFQVYKFFLYLLLLFVYFWAIWRSHQ